MVLAAFLFMKRMSDMTDIKISNFDASEESEENKPITKVDSALGKSGVYVYEINGPFFFGAAHKFIETLRNLDKNAKCIVIRMRYVNSVDATAINALRRMMGVCNDNKIRLVLCELNEQPKRVLTNTGVLDDLGKENVFNKFEEINS